MCWLRSPARGAGGTLAGLHWAPWKLSLQRRTYLTSYSKSPAHEQLPFREHVCSPHNGYIVLYCDILIQIHSLYIHTILSRKFSRPEYWSGLPSLSPGDLPNPGIEPGSPALQADSLPAELSGKPFIILFTQIIHKKQTKTCQPYSTHSALKSAVVRTNSWHTRAGIE